MALDPTEDISPSVIEVDGLTLTPGQVVGPYEIVELAGAGGMGRVYRARDRRLDRLAAIKVLRPTVERGHPRLLAEAQAMARLGHPNVVTVYDVGTVAGRVYLAMEYVDGQTVRAWLDARPRGWREIVAVFLLAGRGLAAAHAAGIVHRDVKPDNLLVGRDGRVRVTDFGLAAIAGASSGEGGTPAYMAPEQRGGGAVDARADQYAFCASLFEALYRQRPSEGLELAERSALAPAWVRHVVLRGLRPEPGARFPSMDALLAALADDPAIRRRRLLVAGALAATGALAVFGLLRTPSPPPAGCDAGGARLAAVWGPATREQMKAAFLATGRPYAADTFARASAALDGYGDGWSAMYRDACEATAVRHEQSAALLDLRMACLDRRLAGMRQTVALLAREPDGAIVDRAAAAAAELEGLQGCADRAALSAVTPLPADPVRRARVLGLEPRVAAARALDRLGKSRSALTMIRPVVDEAHALDHAPLTARALWVAGAAADGVGEYGDAERFFREGVQTAAVARDDVTAARCWMGLLMVVGDRQPRTAEALAMLPGAEAALARGGNDPVLLAGLWGTVASLHRSAGRFAEARAWHERALALLDEERVDHRFDLGINLINLAGTLKEEGKLDEALVVARRALALQERTLGSEHVKVAIQLNTIGDALHQQGKLDEARAAFERALGICDRALGPDSPNCARLHNNLGLVHQSAARYPEALAAFERALAIKERALGPDHPAVSSSVINVAAAYRVLGRRDEALALARRALAIRERAYGPDHPAVAEAVDSLGGALLDAGHAADALVQHRRALAIREKALPADHPDVAYSLCAEGEALLALGRARAALPSLERAAALLPRTSADPHELATARFLLARALWSASVDRARARQLAVAARAELAAEGRRGEEDLRQVDAWLAAR